MKAQKIIALLAVVTILIAVTLMSGCVEKTGETKKTGEEYHLIDTVALEKNEMTEFDGNNYCLLLKIVRYKEGGNRDIGSIVIAVYKRPTSSVLCDSRKVRLMGQKAIGSYGSGLSNSVIIEELKIELRHVDHGEEFASVAVYKKI